MTRLHQLLAIAKPVRAAAERDWTDAYHKLQRPALFTGLIRTYQPYADDSPERLPDESVKVQTTVRELLDVVRGALTRLFDTIAEQEYTNTVARADVIVNGEILLPNVPVTYLLFLERKLVDLRTFVSKLPVLDPTEKWTYDPNAGHYVSETAKTMRTKKVPRNHVKAEATDKHPAQVEVYYEDIYVGTWSRIQFSGMLPAAEVKDMLARVGVLQEAVKTAREAANSVDVIPADVGDRFLGLLFGDQTPRL